MDSDVREAVRKCREAKEWGREQARAADQARRDLKTSEDAGALLQAELLRVQRKAEALELRLAEADSRTVELAAALRSSEKQAAVFREIGLCV